MTRLAFLAAVAALGIAGAAQADEEVIREPDKTVYQEKTEVVFNGAEVDGNTIKPETELVVVKQKSSFGNMIQHRKSFHSELTEKAEE